MGEISLGSSATDETLAGDETLGGSRPDRAKRPRLSRGDFIGRYVVLEQIGVGGMGVVHAAYDPELDRKVAIKVLVPRESPSAEPVARQRLLREAQAMARIRHPNVVAVHDAGVHREQVFVAMEFVEGSTLTKWLVEASRPVPRILDVFVQAGRGLAAAHARGVVHRDFKPDNVMVGDDGHGAPRAQVMDFGLARAAEDVDEDPTQGDDDDLGLSPSQPMTNTLTRVGQIVGTPRFMAPEQHLRGAVDARTDQFAFCVALWLALFDTHPFGGETAAELAGRVIAGSLVEPPSVPGVGVRLRKALRRGLHPEREERWPSMEALLAELTHDPSRSRRRVTWAAAAVLVTGAGVGAWQLSHARAVSACEQQGAEIRELWHDEGRARVREGMMASGFELAADSYERLVPWIDRRVDGWAQARTEACLATEVDGRWGPERAAVAEACFEDQRQELEALLSVLSSADREAVYRSVTIAADLHPASVCADEGILAARPRVSTSVDPGEEREIGAALHRVQTLLAIRRDEEARSELDALIPRLEALEAGPLRARGLRLRAALEERALRYEESEASLRESYLMAVRLGAVDLAYDAAMELARAEGKVMRRPEAGLWWVDVAEALAARMGEAPRGITELDRMELRVELQITLGRYDEALPLAEQAVALAEQALGASHPRVAKSVKSLSFVHRERGDYDLAAELARRVVSMRTSTLGELHPDVALSYEVLAEVLRQTGEHDDALEASRRALALSEQVHPPRSQYVAKARTNVALALQQLGRSQEALPLLEDAIDAIEENLGSDHPDLATMLLNRGNVRQSLDDLTGSHADYQRALTIAESSLPLDHPSRAMLLASLGNAEALLGRHEAAAERLEQAREQLERTRGPEHPSVALVLINEGEVLGNLGRVDESMKAFERSREIIEVALGPDHPDVAWALVGTANALLDLGRPEEALPLAERALVIRESRSVSPTELAQAQWTLFAALDDTDGDPQRMTELARRALPVLEAGGNPQSAQELRAYLEGEGLADSLGGPGR